MAELGQKMPFSLTLEAVTERADPSEPWPRAVTPEAGCVGPSHDSIPARGPVGAQQQELYPAGCTLASSEGKVLIGIRAWEPRLKRDLIRRLVQRDGEGL